MEYLVLLLMIGFVCGGSIAWFASPVSITDEQYREIRSNMRRRKL